MVGEGNASAPGVLPGVALFKIPETAREPGIREQAVRTSLLQVPQHIPGRAELEGGPLFAAVQDAEPAGEKLLEVVD